MHVAVYGHTLLVGEEVKVPNCRLAPQDYHRFHAPCEGSVKGVHHIPGDYYSVKPVAVKSPIDVYGCNKRSILQLGHPSLWRGAVHHGCGRPSWLNQADCRLRR